MTSFTKPPGVSTSPLLDTSAFVDLTDYSVHGDGVSDDTAALQVAVNAAEGQTLVVGDGTYAFTQVTVKSGTTVLCSANAVFKPTANQSAVLFDSPTLRTPTTTYAITADTTVGAYTVTSALGAAALAAGDRVTLRDPGYALGTENPRRETNVVESVGGGVVTLRYPLGHVYTAANNPWIAKLTMASGIRWYGGQADMSLVAGGIAADCDFIEALWPENCLVQGLTVYHHPDKAVDFYGGLNSVIRDCNAYDPTLSGSGEGYNVRLTYSRDCVIEGGWSMRVRHHADISGGQGCKIKGGYSFGRTGVSQVGAFLHGLESRWCSIDGFVGENLTDATMAGNSTFGADYGFTINFQAVGCDRGALMQQGVSGRVLRPHVRYPAAAQPGVEITGNATDVLVVDPDIDMAGIGASAISASSLNASSRVFVSGGRVVMGNASGTVSAISLNLPTGAAGSYGGVEGTIIEGTMVRGVNLPGASTEQAVRNVQFRGVSIGEAVRADAGAISVSGCVFSGTITTAVRAATSVSSVALGRNVWGAAVTKLSNTAGATVVGLVDSLTATATWDPASTADAAMTSTTITVTGAAIGDPVSVGFSNAVPAGGLLVGQVTASNTVTVTYFNKTGGVSDLASGTLRATVWKHS